MGIKQSFDNLPEALYDFGIYQIISEGLIEFNNNQVSLSENWVNISKQMANKRRYPFSTWYRNFSLGIESLIKATFLKHEISLLKKKTLVNKETIQNKTINSKEVIKVYSGLRGHEVISFDSHSWIGKKLKELDIKHPFEIDSGTLGNYISQLQQLSKKQIITAEEESFLRESLTLLKDIRRNVNAHIFPKYEVININDDLNIYVKSINILLKAYSPPNPN